MPYIRIQQSNLLNERFELPSEGLADVVKAYQSAWKKKGDKILAGLEKVSGLTFPTPIIDAYIAGPRNQTTISNPLIIGGGFKPREFVFILTHELTHLLLDENQEHYNWHLTGRSLYRREDWNVAIHIPTLAVYEAVFMDVIKNPDPVIWDIKYRQNSPDHKRAWDIVSEKGYQTIIDNMKTGQKKTSKRIVDTIDFFPPHSPPMTLPDTTEYVVLVDESNQVLGQDDKKTVHTDKTPLHRGFSSFIFNSQRELLLQQRSHTKKTWPAVWSNTCCGHPSPGENVIAAVQRRLDFELGLKVKQLWNILPDYRYRFTLNGIVENELCPVVVGFTDQTPCPNPTEVDAIKNIPWTELLATATTTHPPYSPWCLEQIELLSNNQTFQQLLSRHTQS